jgi:hypothetical protein
MVTTLYRLFRQSKLCFKWIKQHLRFETFVCAGDAAARHKSGSRCPSTRWWRIVKMCLALFARLSGILQLLSQEMLK